MKYRLSKKECANLVRILICLAAFVALFAVDKSVGLVPTSWGRLGFLLPLFWYLVVYVAIGGDILFKAVRNILHGKIFDENFLMAVASLGAFTLAIIRGAKGQPTEGFDEACAVLLFYQVGEFFQRYATGKSRKSIASLMDIRPDTAHLIADGAETTVTPDCVEQGQIVRVYPGEKVPLDGIIVSGQTDLDTKALTGESMPRHAALGDEVTGGFVNITSTFDMQVSCEFYESTVSKILDLVQSQSDKKAKTENFITRFAAVYTPLVVALALLIAVIPGAVTGDWGTWVYRALSFLVVSCPCALVISIPLTFFAGLGVASKYGILVKGSAYLEKLNKAQTFVFDKTGTLTEGCFVVAQVWPEDRRDEVLRLAAAAEKGSSHPIAKSILAACPDIEGEYTQTNVAGMGVIAEGSEGTIVVGSEKLLAEKCDAAAPPSPEGAIHVALNGQYVGYIVVSDRLKEDAPDAIAQLRNMGASAYMLTGDGESAASKVAAECGLDGYRASLLPQNKVEEVEKLLAKGNKGLLCFVGDGVNDAPVLMRADIGVAMGGIGSDAAIEAADVALMDDSLSSLPTAKRIAKRTTVIVYENIVFSLAVKAAILVLSALGITGMWIAVFGDVGVAIIAILNAMRTLLYNPTRRHVPKQKK